MKERGEQIGKNREKNGDKHGIRIERTYRKKKDKNEEQAHIQQK